MKNLKHNLWQLLICVDQLVHCIVGVFLGYKIWADETHSSYQYRRFLTGKTKIKTYIDFVFKHVFRDEDHCKNSYESERNDRHLPPEMREE